MDKYKEMIEKFVLSAIILANKFEVVVGCPGGCIAGAGTNIPVLKAKKDLAAYVKNSTTPIPPKELEEIELE